MNIITACCKVVGLVGVWATMGFGVVTSSVYGMTAAERLVDHQQNVTDFHLAAPKVLVRDGQKHLDLESIYHGLITYHSLYPNAQTAECQLSIEDTMETVRARITDIEDPW